MRELLVSDPEITIEHPTRNQSITENAIQVRGTTNIRSRKAQIEVDLRQRGNVTATVYIRQWNESSWNTTISIPDNVSGQHALTADVGRTAVGRQIIIQNLSGTTSKSLSADANGPKSASASRDRSGEENTQVEQARSETYTTPTPNITKEAVDAAKTSHDGGNHNSTGGTTMNSNAAKSTEVQMTTSIRTLSLTHIVMILVVGCVSIIGWIRSRKS
jgi:cobalamin biosynthesis Mg chelatase CobN